MSSFSLSASKILEKLTHTWNYITEGGKEKRSEDLASNSQERHKQAELKITGTIVTTWIIISSLSTILTVMRMNFCFICFVFSPFSPPHRNVLILCYFLNEIFVTRRITALHAVFRIWNLMTKTLQEEQNAAPYSSILMTGCRLYRERKIGTRLISSRDCIKWTHS